MKKIVPAAILIGLASQKIYGSLFGLGVPVDIIVVTPEDIELYKNDPGSIIAPAVSQGREVYAAR